MKADRMGAGKRDRKIAIQRYTESANAHNEKTKLWSTLAEVWAEKKDVSDREKLQAGEVQSEISTRFVVLNSGMIADVNPKDRIEYPIGSGTYFDIFGVKEIGRRNGFEITASARSDG